MTQLVAQDGRLRNHVTIDRAIFSLWLVGLEVTRIRKLSVRGIVEILQKDAMDTRHALDWHWFGPPASHIRSVSATEDFGERGNLSTHIALKSSGLRSETLISHERRQIAARVSASGRRTAEEFRRFEA